MTTTVFRRTAPAVLAALAALLAGCSDNIGRAFDPNVTPGGGGGTTGPASNVQIVPVGGDAREGRPLVRATFPKGGGWPTTVPVVVEFSESINEASLQPTSANGTDGRLIVRLKGTTQAIPASYDFVLGGRVAILRPPTGFTNTNNQPFEVVLRPEARDADGVRFSGTTETILAEFTVDEATSVADGRILTVLPRDNASDVARESDVFVVFNKPVNAATLQGNLQVRPAGGSALAGTVSTPLRIAGVEDPRVARFRMTGGLPAGGLEVVVSSAITFGTNGTLSFNNRTPFSRFTTVPFQAPTAVTVGNPATGFADKINSGNLANLVVHVTTPVSALAGDRVVARIYGLDPDTQPTDDVNFVERSVALAGDGVQTAVVDFAGALGTVARPEFSDGAALFAVQLQRGGQRSGYFHSASAADVRFDVTPPSLSRAGPPNVVGTNDVLNDQESWTFFGTANEAVAAATLTDGVNTAAMFGSASDGRFACAPLTLGRLTAPRSWSLLLTDRAGNMATAAVTGRVFQRGLLTGAQAGTLVVEAYDEVTLLPVAGATVIVDPGVPTVPPAAGRVIATTGADGRATLTGLVAATHTVTLVRSGYHLVTLYDSGVAHASLPLRPEAGATGTLSGTVGFQGGAGVTALVGDTAFDDPMVLSVRTTTAAPTAIPATAIRPNRPQLISTFTGVFEPAAVPTYLAHACTMCGTDGLTASAPTGPVSVGGTSSPTLAPLTAAGTQASLLAPFTKNLAQATGLDTGNLAGAPTVRMTASLAGFGGQALMGVGFATVTTGASYSVNATYALGFLGLLAPYVPSIWVVTEARDAGGNVSRHRALFLISNGSLIDLLAPPAIPTITAPGGPSTGEPAVTFVDRLDRATLPAGLAIGEVVATDPQSRQWRLLYEDGNGAGGNRTVQFPPLGGTGATGLANGAWSVRAEGRLFLSTTSLQGDLMLEDRRRMEVTYARAAAVTFTVQ